MPTDVTYTDTTTGTNPIFSTFSPSTDAPEENPFFTIESNTQRAELDALRREYPSRMFRTDFTSPILHVLRAERNQIRELINAQRNLQAVQRIIDAGIFRREHSAASVLANTAYRNYSHMSTGRRTFEALERTDMIRDAIQYYRDARDQLNRSREHFRTQYAEYRQREAMIRRKPSQRHVIAIQEIIDVVSRWPNVYAIAAKAGVDEQHLTIRVGICDLEMSEAASESAYQNPQDILLAPFYFTIRLHRDGNFICSSRDRHARGLSMNDAPGTLQYDFHPHQLSDSPCFGSFGQTLIDIALAGDMISLIGGIIAFYGQYNSQDSAGVNARHFHPSRIADIYDIANYKEDILNRLSFSTPHACIDAPKLDHAIARYVAYYNENRNTEEIQRQTPYCTYCNENPVGPDDAQYIPAGGGLVCASCWESEFCCDCERHVEDCECEHEH